MNIKKNQLNSLKYFEGFIGDKRIFVPNYQRRYHWTMRKNWEPFWKSILNLIGKSADDIHFIGNIIIQKKECQSNQEEYTEYEVVDGHQRLATFFLLLSTQIKVLENFIEKTNNKQEIQEASELISKIKNSLVIKTFGTNRRLTRLVPFNTGDKKIFNEILLSENYPLGKRSSSNSLLENAHIYFVENIKNYLKNKEVTSAIDKIFEKMIRSIAFTLVELDDKLTRLEILNVFQTINEKWRKEKAQIEHLFPESPEEDWGKIEVWKEIIKKEEETKKIKNSLGNLSIVDNKGNNEVKNKIWSKKIANKKYKENICLKLEEWGKNLLEEKELTPENIRERSGKLIEEIKKNEIFEFDFKNA